MTDLYFAYGSNLDCQDWRRRFWREKAFDQSSLRPLKMVERVLNDLTAERISERSLAQASGQWAVRWA
jgi:hypothetical protein